MELKPRKDRALGRIHVDKIVSGWDLSRKNGLGGTHLDMT